MKYLELQQYQRTFYVQIQRIFSSTCHLIFKQWFEEFFCSIIRRDNRNRFSVELEKKKYKAEQTWSSAFTKGNHIVLEPSNNCWNVLANV